MAARPRRRSASSNVPGVGARIARPLGCAVRGHSPTAAGPQSLRRGRPVWPPVFRVRLQQAVTRRRRFRAAIKAAPTATTEVRRYKRLFAATAPATRDRFAARADVGIGPYGEIVSWYVQRRHSDTAGIRTRNARYLRRGRRDCAQKLPCARFALRFRGSPCGLSEKFCSRNGPPILLARAKPGRGGGMERDGLVERNDLGNASSWDARRGAPRESGGRSPRRVLGTFPR